jgi:hypothetical protein
MIAAAARLATSLASLEAQILAQREALAQLTSGWHGDAAEVALLRAEKNLQRQLRLQVMLQAVHSALSSGGAQLSSLRRHVLATAGQANMLGGLVGDDGSVRVTGVGLVMTPALAAAYSALLRKLLDTFDGVDRATASALANAGVQLQGHPQGLAVKPDRFIRVSVDRYSVCKEALE